MTKEKLLKLYEKFQTERLNTSFINNMKNFTDHDIYLILISKYTDITIRLIFNNNFQMLHNELKHKLIDIVNNAKNRTIAEYTAMLIENSNVLASGLVYELAKIISETQETYQALNTLSVATNRIVLSSDVLAIHLSEIVSKTIGEQKSFNVAQVATNKDVLLGPAPAITLTQIVSEISSDCKSDLAASIAKNKILQESPFIITYTLKIKNAKTDEEARLIYSKIRKEINKLKKEKEEYLKKKNEEYIDESTFWQIYEQNPEEAIILLSEENIKGNEEITTYTKIRKKII